MKIRHCLLLFAVFGLACCESRKLVKPAEDIDIKVSEGNWVSEIPAGGFNEFTEQKGKLVIIDFNADWCGPCRRLAPLLDKIAAERAGEVVVGKVNVDRFRDVASREGVEGIPDVRLYRDGRMVDRFVGLPSESELRGRIDRHSTDLVPEVEPEVKPEVEKASPQSTTQPMTKDWLPKGMQRR
jgi:thioredoxin